MALVPGQLSCALQEGTLSEPSLNQLEWMAGHWISRKGDRHSEEFWLPAAGRLNAEIQGLQDGEPYSVRWIWESITPPVGRLEEALPQ
jgi:hypothetical protein